MDQSVSASSSLSMRRSSEDVFARLYVPFVGDNLAETIEHSAVVVYTRDWGPALDLSAHKSVITVVLFILVRTMVPFRFVSLSFFLFSSSQIDQVSEALTLAS